MSCILYQAVNAQNGHRYIGITSVAFDLRVRRHHRTAKSGRGAIVGSAIRKYGSDIKFSMLAVCPDWEYAKQAEMKAIEVFKPEYNVTKGGDGALGYRHTAEHKEQARKRQIGKQYFLGRRHSDETKQKMAQTRRLYWLNHPVERPIRVKLDKLGSAIECVNTGEIFRSVSSAARKLNISRASLKEVLRGRWTQTRGLTFRYTQALKEA